MTQPFDDRLLFLTIIGVFLLIFWLTTGAGAAACPPEEVWALCREDTIGCYRLYESRGLSGIKQAMKYHDLVEQNHLPLPYVTFLYNGTNVFTLCNATGTVSAGEEGHIGLTKLAILDALLRYRFLTTAVVACSDPSKVEIVDETTGQTRCVCKPDHVCVESDDSSAATLTDGYILATVAISLLGALLIVFMAIAVYTFHQADKTLQETVLSVAPDMLF